MEISPTLLFTRKETVFYALSGIASASGGYLTGRYVASKAYLAHQHYAMMLALFLPAIVLPVCIDSALCCGRIFQVPQRSLSPKVEKLLAAILYAGMFYGFYTYRPTAFVTIYPKAVR